MKLTDLSELVVLNKALLYVKFKASDDDSTYLSNSPILNSLLDKVQEALAEKHAVEFDISKSLFLKNHKAIKELVLTKTKNLTGWDEFDLRIKKESLRTIAYPYKISDEEIEELLKP